MSKNPSESAPQAPAPPAPGDGEPPRVFLRTVYPLNPGIPHHLDFPRGR